MYLNCEDYCHRDKCRSTEKFDIDNCLVFTCHKNEQPHLTVTSSLFLAILIIVIVLGFLALIYWLCNNCNLLNYCFVLINFDLDQKCFRGVQAGSPREENEMLVNQQESTRRNDHISQPMVIDWTPG